MTKFRLDEIDKNIISILLKEGRISNIDLSEKVGISPSPCLRRVKALQDKGVIKGFFADINYSFLGFNLGFLASINVDYKTDEERKKFEDALKNIKEVTNIFVLSTDKDYLLQVVAKDFLDYKKIVNNFLIKLPFVKKIRTTKINRIMRNNDLAID